MPGVTPAFFVHGLGQGDEFGAAQVKHGFCLQIISFGKRAAFDQDHAAHTHRPQSEQVALQSDTVAVAAGKPGDGVNALPDKEAGQCQWSDLGPAVGVIRHLDGIDAAGQLAGLLHCFVNRGSPGQEKFSSYRETGALKR